MVDSLPSPSSPTYFPPAYQKPCRATFASDTVGMVDGGVALAAAFCAAASDAKPPSTRSSTDIILYSFISVPSPDLRTCKKDPDSITLPPNPGQV